MFERLTGQKCCVWQGQGTEKQGLSQTTCRMGPDEGEREGRRAGSSASEAHGRRFESCRDEPALGHRAAGMWPWP